MPERFLVTYPEKGDFFDNYDTARQFAQQKTVDFPDHTIELWVPVTSFAQTRAQQTIQEDIPVMDMEPVPATTDPAFPQAAQEFDDGA